MFIIIHSWSTLNKNGYPLPLFDVRVKENNKISWEDLSQTKKQMLQAYQITISKILSRLTPTDFSAIRHHLIYDYFFESSVVDDLFYFVTTHETKQIEFEEIDNCRKDEIYLRPRIKLNCPIGEYSIWVPDRR